MGNIFTKAPLENYDPEVYGYPSGFNKNGIVFRGSNKFSKYKRPWFSSTPGRDFANRWKYLEEEAPLQRVPISEELPEN